MSENMKSLQLLQNQNEFSSSVQIFKMLGEFKNTADCLKHFSILKKQLNKQAGLVNFVHNYVQKIETAVAHTKL